MCIVSFLKFLETIILIIFNLTGLTAQLLGSCSASYAVGRGFDAHPGQTFV